MPVIIDAIGTAMTGVAVTSFSLTTLTVGAGKNRALVASVAFFGVPGILTFSWDSVSMLYLGDSQTTLSNYDVYMFGMVNPTSGAKTLNITWIGSMDAVMDAVSFTGVNQTGGTTSFANGITRTNSTSPPSILTTSAVGDIVVAAIVVAGSPVAISASTGTLLWQACPSSGGGALCIDGAATVVATFSESAASDWGLIAIDLVTDGISPPNFVDHRVINRISMQQRVEC